MTYGEFVVGRLYVYRAKEGSGYSRYEGKCVQLTRKCDKDIKLLEIQFLDGARRGEKRIVNSSELVEAHQ